MFSGDENAIKEWEALIYTTTQFLLRRWLCTSVESIYDINVCKISRVHIWNSTLLVWFCVYVYSQDLDGEKQNIKIAAGRKRDCDCFPPGLTLFSTLLMCFKMIFKANTGLYWGSTFGSTFTFLLAAFLRLWWPGRMKSHTTNLPRFINNQVCKVPASLTTCKNKIVVHSKKHPKQLQTLWRLRSK